MHELAQATLKAEEAEAREQSSAKHAGLQELENVSDRESGPAADVDEWLRKS
jgi:hypothetical protein